MTGLRWWAGVILLVAGTSNTASAADGFDFLYMDHVDAVFTGEEAFFSSGIGFAILANTGEVAITADELLHARFDSTPSVPGAQFVVMLGHLPTFGPVAQGNAVGDVTSPTVALMDLLHPGESFANTEPDRVLTYLFQPPTRTFVGEVDFRVVMSLGGQEATFPMRFDVQQGSRQSVQYVSAARVSSGQVVAANSLTWGRLKSLYR
jgi:hypothetical protein